MTAVASASVVAAGMVMIVVVVIAANAGVVRKLTHQQRLYRLICIAADAAVQLNIDICQRHLSAATDTAADQGVHTLCLQKACQCAVSVTGGIYHLRRQNLAVLHFIDLKSGGMTKMLKNLSALIGYCNFHKIIPFPNTTGIIAQRDFVCNNRIPTKYGHTSKTTL